MSDVPGEVGASEEPPAGPLDRVLRLFGDVRPGESATVLLMCLNVFLLLMAYYILKTAREPLILLAGGAELKSYAAAAQALTLIAYVPLYGWAAQRLPRQRFLAAVILFFVVCIQLFYLGHQLEVPHLGFIFFVWVGIFSLTTIAQFWSYANEIYTRPEGNRLFPLIAIGSTAGAPLGAAAAARMFGHGRNPFLMMEVAAVILLVHLVLYRVVAARMAAKGGRPPVEPIKAGNGFALVLKSPYLRLVALLLVILNIVNTVGEYILGQAVVAHAEAEQAIDAAFNKQAYIGMFYGHYFLLTNLAAIALQAFVVSRLVKRFGLRGAVFSLPVVAFFAYGMAASGAALSVLLYLKVAENSTDYSVMNTAKQMIWLPTSREEKYKAKQAIDTFFVRSGDMLAAGVVFVGTHFIHRGVAGFARLNMIFVVLAMFVAWRLLVEYRRLTATAPAAAPASPGSDRMKAASAVLIAGFLMGPAAVAFAAESGKPEMRRVVADEEYKAGGWHQYWFGRGYRDLWTMPVELPVLDLKTEAGGLTPLRQVGGFQTPGLAFKGANGRAYTFRNLIKHPERILPPEWRDTVPAGLFRDAMSAGHPGVSPIFSHIARSVGLIYQESRLAVMPDDPALGEFRATFANQVGTFDSYPLPGVDGITEVVGSQGFWMKWLESPQNRVDSRQFLKARLLDLAAGNWDRHRNQWRWALVQGKPLWQPVPEDPDQCFTLYGGVAVGAVRKLQPKLMEYSGKYPGSIEGLTASGAELTRWLLSDLEWPVYEEVARELQAQLTDAVIDEAMRKVPPEWHRQRGAEVAASFRQRRDGLLGYARKFYEHVADRVDVRGSNTDDVARVIRGADGTVDVELATARPDGSESGPYFKRRFSPQETEEVRIYLQGGQDKLVKTGQGGGITVRVLGGPGDDTLDDSKSGHADLRDFEGDNTFVSGPGTKVRQGVWTNPLQFKDGTWVEPRSYGHWTAPVVQLWVEPTQQFMVGGGLVRTSWGFRKSPWANVQSVGVLYSTGYQNVRLSYTGQWRLTASRLVGRVDLKASGIEDFNYFGSGNDSTEVEEDLYQTRQFMGSAFPSLRLQVNRGLEAHLGVEVKGLGNYANDTPTLLEQEQPYGAGRFGEVALRGGFELDTRGIAAAGFAGLDPAALAASGAGLKVSGVRLKVEAAWAPEIWDVESAFGGVDASLSGYLGNKTVVLAARVGGRTVWGRYPWFEAAEIGGSHNVRGYYPGRFRGDSSLYGNVELRYWLPMHSTPVLPLRLGLFGFADAGRVWLEGEDSDTWHPAYGGGLLAQLVGMPLTFSTSAASGDEGVRINFVMGYSF